MIASENTIPHTLVQELMSAPDRVAVVLATRRDETSLTMKQLLQGAAAYAERYRQADLVAGDVIVDLLRPSPDLLYAFLGGMLLGAVPSILPFRTEKLDPVRYRESLLRLMEVTRPAALVADRDLALELNHEFSGREELRAILEADLPENPEQGPIDPDRWEGLWRDPRDIALLQHSSGTTGLQKGIALSHQAILNQLKAYSAAIRLEPQDTVVSWLPLYHDMGLIAGFLLPILTGTRLILISPFEWVRAPWLLLQAVSKYGGTLSWLPNFAYNFCAQRIPDSRLDGVDLSSWRAVINCSEPMYAQSHRLFRDRFSRWGLPKGALATSYGMAENVFAVTQGGIDGPVAVDCIDAHQFEECGIAVPAAPDSRRVLEMVSAGQALPNLQLRVVSQDGRNVRERAVGELILKSDCMLTGYYRRPDVTRDAFLDGWYRTGDLGYIAEGEIYITGRKKDLIIVGGKNIYPQDIEQLINAVPGVYPGRSVVFGIANPQLGTEEVAAVVETDPRAPVDSDRLRLAILEAVSGGSEVALRYVKLVDERWLIKTSSGKLARQANRDKFLVSIDDEESDTGSATHNLTL